MHYVLAAKRWRAVHNAPRCHGAVCLCGPCYGLYVCLFVTSRSSVETNQWIELVFMAALHSRCGHYIFALWFLSFFLLLSFFLA